MEINALFGASLRQFRNHIPLERRCINDVVVGHLGVIHRETIMMTRGEADIFCSGSLDCLNPSMRIKRDGIESAGRLGIFLRVYTFIKIPFSLCEHTVDSPMEEDSEPVILEPFASLYIFFCRNIVLLCTSHKRSGQHHG